MFYIVSPPHFFYRESRRQQIRGAESRKSRSSRKVEVHFLVDSHSACLPDRLHARATQNDFTVGDRERLHPPSLREREREREIYIYIYIYIYNEQHNIILNLSICRSTHYARYRYTQVAIIKKASHMDANIQHCIAIYILSSSSNYARCNYTQTTVVTQACPYHPDLRALQLDTRMGTKIRTTQYNPIQCLFFMLNSSISRSPNHARCSYTQIVN